MNDIYIFCNFVEIDVLDSFELEDGKNGVQDSSSCHSNNGYYFSKTTKSITACEDVLSEYIELLRTHRSFIVTMKIQPQPFHKGSLIWLEQKSTGIYNPTVCTEVL